MTIIYNKGAWIENNFLQNSEKEIKSLLLNKSKLNLKLLSFSHETEHFYNTSAMSLQHPVYKKRAS